MQRMTVPGRESRRLISSPAPLALALASALGLAPLAAQAASISVTTQGDSGQGSDCTLRQAIASTNAGTVEGTGCIAQGEPFGTNDTITFDTTLFPDGGTNTIVLADSPGNHLDVSAVQLTIDASANGRVSIERDAAATNAFRILRDTAADGGRLTLDHLDLRNGSSQDGDCNGYASGGGICIPFADLELIQSTVSGSSADYGGGIYSGSGSVALTDSAVLDNTGNINGGGVYSYVDGSVEVVDSTLSGNSTYGSGGGLLSVYGTVTVVDSTLSDNAAYYSGGGIYAPFGSMTVTSSTVSGNSAAYGGGVASFYGTTSLTNSTLHGNDATYVGGGIGSFYGELTLVNNTISANSANQGGGVFDDGQGTQVTAIHSILAGNTQGSGGDFVGALTSDSSGNLFDVDPMLGPLADNGGSTQTMLPLPGSPAIDAVACTAAPATDQRGAIRPDPGNPSTTPCDIGSVEANSLPDRIFRSGFD